MRDPQARLPFVRQMRRVPLHDLVEVRDLADGVLGVDVDGGGLRKGDLRKRLDLAWVVGGMGSEGGEADGGDVEGGKSGEGADGGEPAKRVSVGVVSGSGGGGEGYDDEMSDIWGEGGNAD